MVFEEDIKTWVTLDNTIKNLNDKLKETRLTRTNISTNILVYN